MTALTSPDGVRLVYNVEGEGPPLVLHLGAGCNAQLWRSAGYMGPLSREYRCILFDHRGHGQSGKPLGPGANHIDHFVSDVVALLDHLSLDRAAFWGYSNGTTVGLKLAQDHPARVKALVGSGGVGRTTPEIKDRIATVRIPEFREYGWEKLIARFADQEPEGVPEWMKDAIRSTDIQQFIDWCLAMPDWNWDEWGSLLHVSAPTLFVVGEREDPTDETAEGAALMTHGERIRIAGQGHIGAFIRSHLVLPDVMRFLAEYT